MSVASLVLNEIHTHDDFEYPRPGMNLLIAESKINEILNHCERQELGLDVNLITLEFMNSTHHIDNILCEWHTNEHPLNPNHPDYISPGYENEIKTGIYLNNTFIPDVD